MGTLRFPELNEHSMGISSRVFADVFAKTREQSSQTSFRVSFLELYNGKIHDLLLCMYLYRSTKSGYFGDHTHILPSAGRGSRDVELCCSS